MKDIKVCDKLLDIMNSPEPKKPLVLLGLYMGGVMVNLEREILDNPLTKDADIWTLNDWHSSFPNLVFDKRYNIKRVFQLHANFEEVRERKGFNDHYIEWEECCNNRGLEVVSFHELQGIEKNKIFPLKRILKKYPREWFYSSMGWMIALAIDEGYDAIYLRRIRVGTTDEFYTKQTQSLLQMCNDVPEYYNVMLDSPWRFAWEEECKKVDWSKIDSVDTALYGTENLYGLKGLKVEF